MTEGGRELTVRAVLLGVAITSVFTAANVYLGLSVGLTFATSIPAAVISMALLRAVRGSSILENNIVQTVASAAGTLAAMGFVLPGLVMIGWWRGFPFWPSFAVCAAGGILGVMFSIPLRRALVVGTDLPFPEGVAAAEVLKIGSQSRDAGDAGGEGRAGLRLISTASVAAFLYAALGETRLLAKQAAAYVHIGSAATGLTAGLQLALVGAGHLVGLSVGIAMGVGVLIAWGAGVPLVTALAHAPGPAAEVAEAAWSGTIRFVGAGAIGVAALWSLAGLAAPLARGLTAVARGPRRTDAAGTVPRTERDMPIGWVAGITLALLPPLALALWLFLRGTPLAPLAGWLVPGAILYILLSGAFVAAACGYMAGLIGASNSPLSGIGILAILGAAGLLAAAVAPFVPGDASTPMIAFALFVTGVIFAAATIANDNLQDLRTGQLVGATPWRQQVALICGVLAGAAVIPPTLDLLNQAHGFAGVASGPGGGHNPLPAPQATLITALARGVLGGGLDWGLIGTGMLVGAGLVVLDELLGRAGRMRLPPLAVGLGIYLPASVTLAVVLGAVTGHAYERRRTDERGRRMGVLMASGLIVGESLWGVTASGLIVASGRPEPLALVGDGFATAGTLIGLVIFAGVIAWLYRQAINAGG